MAAGVSGAFAVVDERAAPGAGGRNAHVEHERAGEFGEGGVVERVGG